MGIFAESAWFAYEMINQDLNSLTAYLSDVNSWHFVVTRENICLKNVKIFEKKITSKNSYSLYAPKERIWNKDNKDFPFYAIYFVPWSTIDDGLDCEGMVQLIDNKFGNKKTRISRLGNNYMKIHKFLSDFQYPFLNDIKNIDNVHFYFHKYKFKKYNFNKEIVKSFLSIKT